MECIDERILCTGKSGPCSTATASRPARRSSNVSSTVSAPAGKLQPAGIASVAVSTVERTKTVEDSQCVQEPQAQELPVGSVSHVTAYDAGVLPVLSGISACNGGHSSDTDVEDVFSVEEFDPSVLLLSGKPLEWTRPLYCDCVPLQLLYVLQCSKFPRTAGSTVSGFESLLTGLLHSSCIALQALILCRRKRWL